MIVRLHWNDLQNEPNCCNAASIFCGPRCPINHQHQEIADNGPHRHFLRAVPPCVGAFLVLTAILCYLFENKRFQDAPIGDMIK